MLAYSRNPGAPAITDVVFTNEAADNSLFEDGYYRLPQDLNRQCSMGSLRRRTFLYYKRDYQMHLAYAEIMLRTVKVVAAANACIERDDAKPLPPWRMTRTLKMVSA